MKTFYAAILAFLLSIPAAPVALAADGLVKILGARSVQSTLDSLENLLRN